MSRMLAKMNLISVVQQLPKEDVETIQSYIEMIEKENRELNLELSGYRQAILNNKEMLGLKEENQELKKQVEEYQQELEKADSITQSCVFNGKEESKISYRKCLNMLDKKETQQKEFIKYLEDEKNRLARECSNIYEDSLGHTRLVNEDKFDEVNDILQKYKSIIGGSDENKTTI